MNNVDIPGRDNDAAARIFVASTPAEWLPMKVLEFSIIESSSIPASVNAIYQFNREIPVPRSVKNRPRTPFSFQRFLIPELCDYNGRAIYMDADMLVFEDIAKLWNQPLHDFDLLTVEEGSGGRVAQFSVMLLDCEKLLWNIDDIVNALDVGDIEYSSLMYEMRLAEHIGKTIPATWNSLENYSDETALLHYTDMNTQPWVSTSNPLGHLWVAALHRAIEKNFITRSDIEREVVLGHVRPSLLAQIDMGMDDPISIPNSIRRLDRGFVAPYQSLHAGKSLPWTSLRSAFIAYIRRAYYESPLSRIFR